MRRSNAGRPTTSARSHRAVVAVAYCLFALALGRVEAGAPATWQGTIARVPSWITVVPRGHEISPSQRESEPWWTWGNTTSDAYLFAFEDPGTVFLILEFRERENGLPEARLYVRDRGASALEYALDGDDLQVTSDGGNPYLILQAEGGGWVEGGKTNYNLTLFQDFYDCGFEIPPDGNPDWKFRVGSEAPGLPSWQTGIRLFDPHPGWGCGRFAAHVRMQNAPPFKVSSPLMPGFPYLGIGLEPSNWFVRNPNPLYYDLQDPTRGGRQLRVFPFTGFHIGGMYQINSNALPPKVNFESPFVFYNFDSDTRYADLVIRGGGTRAGQGQVSYNHLQRNEIRYSWKVFSDFEWKYGFHIAGTHEYEEELRIGDELLVIPSAENYPNWVVDNSWPLVTFVEAVNGYTGSEGIYFYGAPKEEIWPWLTGAEDVPLTSLEEPFLQEDQSLIYTPGASLPPDFRGEYSTVYREKPTMYFSPVDNRLHLLHAMGGLWNLGQAQVLRMHNLSGGAHIDGWTRESVPKQADVALPRALPGEVEEALYLFGDYLLYAGASGVELRRGSFETGSFVLRPPTDEASWQEFREELEPYRDQERDPHDLESWLRALPGQAFRLSGAELSDVHATSHGFNFVLDIPETAQKSGDPEAVPLLAGLGPGRYVVRYDEQRGQWSSEPATEPQIHVSLQAEGLREHYPTRLRLEFRNEGTVAWQGPVSLSVGGELLGAKDALLIPGKQTVAWEVAWTPGQPGTHAAELQLGSRTIPLNDVEVASIARVQGLAALLIPHVSPATALLALLAVAAAVIVLRKAWNVA